MSIKILPIPKIPRSLIDAANKGELVLFVGAGVSKLAGCPSWDELANKMLDDLVKRGQLNYAQFECIKNLPPRTKLTICCSIGKASLKLLRSSN